MSVHLLCCPVGTIFIALQFTQAPLSSLSSNGSNLRHKDKIKKANVPQGSVPDHSFTICLFSLYFFFVSHMHRHTNTHRDIYTCKHTHSSTHACTTFPELSWSKFYISCLNCSLDFLLHNHHTVITLRNCNIDKNNLSHLSFLFPFSLLSTSLQPLRVK